jgi:hypothetical protein
MIKYLVFVWIVLFSSSGLHPIHVSVTEINYDEKEKSLEVMMRIFVDDLETTMRKRHNQPELDITSPADKSLDQMMEEYLNESLTISLDGKRQPLSYLGNEREGDAFIFYVEVPKVRKWKTIAISNSVLTSVFDDQSNLVHVTCGGNVKSLRLNKSNPQGQLSFQQ